MSGGGIQQLLSIKEKFLLRVFILSIALVLTQAPLGWSAPAAEGSAKVKGFRSAEFGMKKNDVYKAIKKDFKLRKKDVKEAANTMEKTTSLNVKVDNLIESGGSAKVVYIFGFKSNKLIQINVIWGTHIDSKIKPENLVNNANLLRGHFANKGFPKDKTVMNAKMDNGSVLVFRGTDKADRMVMLLLTIPQEKSDDQNKPVPPTRGSLQLFYIENSISPDIFRFNENDF